MRKVAAIIILVLFLTIPLTAQIWETLGPHGGRIIQVMPDPNSPDSVYCVSEGSSEPSCRLMRTPDAGGVWDTLNWYNGFTLHPNTAETLFAALGIGSFSDGILRSNDYGNTYGPMAVCWLYLAQGVIYDNVDPGTLFGWGERIERSTDGGEIWETVYDPMLHSIPLGVTVDPTANNRVWAWDDGGRLHFSPDFGRTWSIHTTFTEDRGPIDLAVAHSDSSIMFMANWAGVSRTGDCGETWTHIDMPSAPSNCVWISPVSPNNILAGGRYGLIRSFDGGASWGHLGDSIGYEIMDIAVLPDGSGSYYIYAATYGNGVIRTHTTPFSEGPVVIGFFPLDSVWISLDTFAVTLDIADPDGIDPASVSLSVDGVTYSSLDPELTVTDTMLIFEDYFGDSDRVEVSLLEIEDVLGNPGEFLPASWCFFVDRHAPELAFIFPDSGATVPNIDLPVKLYFEDAGSGLDIPSFIGVFDSVTVDPLSISFLYEDDTVFIDLNSAGLVVEPGETVSVLITLFDLVILGEPNELLTEWEFYIEPSHIDERALPKNAGISVIPNPFNTKCRISAPGDIYILDLSGRFVRKIEVDDYEPAFWDGRGENGEELPSGMYLIRSVSGEGISANAILLK